MPSTNTPVHTSAQTQEHKTAAHPFFQCNLNGDLFVVREGVPSVDALNKALCFLGTAREISINTIEAAGGEAPWAAPYLIEIATGIIQSVVSSMEFSAEGG